MNKLSRVLNHPWITAIRGGLLSIQGIVFIVCFVTIFVEGSTDILQYFNYVNGNENWVYFLRRIIFILNIFIPILPVITISYKLVKIKNQQRYELQENALLISLIGFMAFVLSSSLYMNHIRDVTNIVDNHMFLVNAFLSIVTAIFSTEIYYLTRQQFRKVKKFLQYDNDQDFRDSLQYMIPAVLTIIICLFSAMVMISLAEQLLPIVSIIFKEMIAPLGGFANKIAYVILTQLCWFVGINGGNLIHSSFFEYLFSYEMIDKTFLDTFINIGGTGTIVGLLVSMIYFVKSHKNSQFEHLVKLSILPALFNINEMIIYGLSILFNPIYFIPFLIVPIILTAITSFLQQVGVIPSTLYPVDWRTPIFISGYLTTHSISGSLVQLFNIIIAALIYYPFINYAHLFYKSENNKLFNDLKGTIFSEERETKYLVIKDDELGCMARRLGRQLKGLLNDGDQLFLVFQPQVNKANEVIGVEALLRWNHPDFGMVPPNVIVTIAEENSIIYELGKWTIKEACSQLRKWNDESIVDIKMSINISNLQLKDSNFADDVLFIIKECQVNISDITLEITESIAIGQDEITKNQMNKLTEAGIKFAIDDFGKGYNPILYLKEYSISSIKLDGSLIKDITEDINSKYIVASMYHLCQNSKLDIVCEFVETEEQKRLLDTLGDGVYQGYLFRAHS